MPIHDTVDAYGPFRHPVVSRLGPCRASAVRLGLLLAFAAVAVTSSEAAGRRLERPRPFWCDRAADRHVAGL